MAMMRVACKIRRFWKNKFNNKLQILPGLSCLSCNCLCFSMQFSQTEGYQPASLRLIKEALKMDSPNKNLHTGSRAQSEGNEPKTH